MNSENEYWEDIVSRLHDQNQVTEMPREKGSRFVADYKRAAELKQMLRKVFRWDLFDKKEAKLRLDYRLHKNDNSIVKLSRRVWIRAAVILIAVISGAVLHTLVPGSFKESRFTEIVVPLGQMTQIKLSDGSKIWLNSGSVFKYPTEFGQTSREVFIDGEAFMEVAKDKHNPFIVNAKEFSVKVLGTSFNITAYSTDSHANVTLVEGSVLLHSEDKKWERNISPGQSAMLLDGKVPEVSNVKTDFYTSWKEGKIVFRNETLEEIAKKMERWYNVEVQFKDEELKKLTFSGTFLKYKPVEQVFRSISIMNDNIDFVSENRTEQKNIIHITKKNN